ncbi:MAG: HAD family hydrolase [Bacteroidales bacterium]|nr:HAD family hydrolase [Bacteroidales bacterium]
MKKMEDPLKPMSSQPQSGKTGREMKKAIFLDRDGVLCDNSTHYYITKEEEMILNPGVTGALSVFSKRGYMLIVITNQGGISTGQNTRENVERVHRYIQEDLRKEGIHLDEIYYCPHHSENENCLCRKPLPLLLEKALARFGIDPAVSYFIGDSERDMEAGVAAGIPSILAPSNGNLMEVVERIK